MPSTPRLLAEYGPRASPRIAEDEMLMIAPACARDHIRRAPRRLRRGSRPFDFTPST